MMLDCRFAGIAGEQTQGCPACSDSPSASGSTRISENAREFSPAAGIFLRFSNPTPILTIQRSHNEPFLSLFSGGFQAGALLQSFKFHTISAPRASQYAQSGERLNQECYGGSQIRAPERTTCECKS